MNYCVYNRKLDRFLFLIHFYSDDGGPPENILVWFDEFKSELPDPNKVKAFFSACYNASSDPGDKKRFRQSEWDCKAIRLLLSRHVIQKKEPKIHIKDIEYVPIVDGIPDFEKASAF